jgi:hypothetical protein
MLKATTDREACTAGCDIFLSRRTIRRHLRYGCPGSEQRAELNRHAEALHALAHQRTPYSTSGRQHYHQRNTPSTSLRPSISQRNNTEQHPVLPPLPGEPGVHPPSLEVDFDARRRHMDFEFETAGAGPSSRSPSPTLASTQVHLGSANGPPQPPGGAQPWHGNLELEDLLSQQIYGDLAREGGEIDCLLVHLLSY